MSSLKVFISSSVVASPFCLVELWLAIFWAVFTAFSCFLVVANERGVYASPRTCSLAQSKEEPPAYFEKRVCLFLALGKVTMVLKTF